MSAGLISVLFFCCEDCAVKFYSVRSAVVFYGGLGFYNEVLK